MDGNVRLCDGDYFVFDDDGLYFGKRKDAPAEVQAKIQAWKTESLARIAKTEARFSNEKLWSKDD